MTSQTHHNSCPNDSSSVFKSVAFYSFVVKSRVHSSGKEFANAASNTVATFVSYETVQFNSVSYITISYDSI